MGKKDIGKKSNGGEGGMKRLAVFLAAALLVVLGLGQAASADWEGGACKLGGPSSEWTADKWQNQAAFLGLTDEQSAKIKNIRQENFNNTKDLRAKLQNSVFDLKQMSWDKNTDPAKFNAKLKEVNGLRDQLHKQSQNCREQIKAVLTPEQQAKMAQKRSGHKGEGQGPRE
jgi:protein CpxP